MVHMLCEAVANPAKVIPFQPHYSLSVHGSLIGKEVTNFCFFPTPSTHTHISSPLLKHSAEVEQAGRTAELVSLQSCPQICD